MVWSIMQAMSQGYVHKPRDHFAMFTKEKHCAVLEHVVYTRWNNKAGRYDTASGNATDARCAKQCDECARIAHENDYVRGLIHKERGHYPVPAIKIEVDYVPFKGMGVAIYLTETSEGIDDGRYWIYHDDVMAWDKNGQY